MRQADWLDIDTSDTPTRPKRRPWLLIGAAVPWVLVVALVVPGSNDSNDNPNTEVAANNQDADATADPGDADATADSGDADATADSGDADATADPGDADAATDPGDAPVADSSPPAAGTDGTAGAEAATSEHPDAHEETDTRSDTDVQAETDELPDDALAQSLRIAELRGDWRVNAGVEEAAALAVVAARAWLTGVDPVLDDLPTAGGDGYAEHLVVEAIEHPGADAAVVTVVGVILDSNGQNPSVQRVAVPIVFTEAGPQPGGEPWALAAPSLEPAEPARTAHNDPDAEVAAAEALEAADLGQLVALYETDGWPVIAEVATDTGDEDDTADVWLRPHLDGFVVAGTTLTPPESDPGVTGAAPSEEPE